MVASEVVVVLDVRYVEEPFSRKLLRDPFVLVVRESLPLAHAAFANELRVEGTESDVILEHDSDDAVVGHGVPWLAKREITGYL